MSKLTFSDKDSKNVSRKNELLKERFAAKLVGNIHRN